MCPARGTGPPAARAGFTLIELVMTASLLTLGLLAVTSSILNTQRLRTSLRERRLADNALRSTQGTIRAFASSAAADPATWASSIATAFSAGGLAGDSFEVEGLAPVAGEDVCGSILVVTDETLSDTDLGIDLGLPRDLNGNGDEDDPDVKASAFVLPVVLRVRWSVAGGEREVSAAFLLSRL